jgi:hypothetical protein
MNLDKLIDKLGWYEFYIGFTFGFLQALLLVYAVLKFT